MWRGFFDAGIDLSTAGADLATIAQSLAKRLPFEEFTPQVEKIRQTGFAMGLERQFTNDQILAFWLDKVEMGRGPEGWMTDFFSASESVYDRAPPALSNKEYQCLLAVLITPDFLNMMKL